MQQNPDQENFKIKQRNTFQTDSSKRENYYDKDQDFKIERQKYLEQKLYQRRLIKKFKNEKFGSSSSESQKSVKNISSKRLIKDFQQNQQTHQPKAQNKFQNEDFHVKHQAYIKQKLARKKQIIDQRRKQFGTSSSESDQLFRDKKQIHKSKPVQIISNHHQKLLVETTNDKYSSRKGSLYTQNNQKSKEPISIKQIFQKKCQTIPDSKKIVVLLQSKKNMQWIEETMIIEKQRIKLINQNVEFLIADVTKIKLFFTIIQKDFLKMKITVKDDDYFLAISSTKKINNLDQYYFVFSRIIQQKMFQIGFEPKKNQSTIFPNYMNLKDVSLHTKYYSAIVYGNILKKSQVLGNWQTRFVYITSKEIGSSKKPNEKPSMTIASDSIFQMWSRFDIESNNMLNIKIMYNSGKKTQFGIPITNFTDKLNWLYCFYQIIRKRQ